MGTAKEKLISNSGKAEPDTNNLAPFSTISYLKPFLHVTYNNACYLSKL